MLFLTLRKITACIWRVLLHLVQYWVSEIYFSGWCFWRKCFWRSTRIEIVDFNIMMIWSWNKHVLFRCFFLFPNMCLYYSVDVCAFKRLLIPSNNHLHNREITYLISSLISSLYFLQFFYTIHSLIFPYMEKYFATYLDIFYLFHRLNPYMFDKGWYQTLFFYKEKKFSMYSMHRICIFSLSKYQNSNFIKMWVPNILCYMGFNEMKLSSLKAT